MITAKRLFDLCGCAAAVPIFGVPATIIAVLIRLDDRGPVFFVQERIGRFGKPFRCLKFRTMRDGKVTRVGRWLRATGLDEIAQFANIFRGEMSVVGPRPLTAEDIERIGWDTTDRRFHAAPGITGLAQFHAGRSARRSLACDRYYASHQGLSLDIQIVLLSFVINAVGKRRFKALRTKLA